ncbi:MAG: transcriptional repressor [Deltaproteobacteria bacterium]|nr:transcriptional repressor [Deltaproteobacteria bacterium]MBW2253199.1 transcriptional repressor [Deltaproteobacteria bacterium]
MQRFRSYLLRNGLKYTRQRQAIAEVFYRGNKHLSLQELLDLAREREASIGYATVYRTMKLLAEGGLAVEHQFADGQARYEPAEEGEHHDHIICLRCGRIVEFEDPVIESRQNAIASREGFRVSSHKLEIYGECLDTECRDLEGSGDDDVVL